MSRRNPKYDNSPWEHFSLWREGRYDPSAGHLETIKPEETASGENMRALREHIRQVRLSQQDLYTRSLSSYIKGFNRIYRVLAVSFALFLTVILLLTVSYLPAFGDVSAPENNEVAQRYIEQGLAETGAVNIVAGMILDYRAFDTFGESCVLFAAACCVLMLLRVDKEEDPHSQAVEDMLDRHFEPHRDTILQMASHLLVPVIVGFGVYVVLNGHLSPGGGFSGGAIIGAGLILHLTS